MSLVRSPSFGSMEDLKALEEKTDRGGLRRSPNFHSKAHLDAMEKISNVQNDKDSDNLAYRVDRQREKIEFPGIPHLKQ